MYMELSLATKLFERPNVSACAYLLSKLNVDYIQEICKPDEIKRSNYTHVKSVLQQFVKHGELEITYKKSKDDYKEIFRSYGNGIQGIPTAFRGTICNGIMTDYDMVNCHPVIIFNICKKNNISCPYLEQYCTQRKQLLEEKKATKVDILRSINKRQRLKDCTPFMDMFDTEMKYIQRECMARHPDLVELAKEKQNKNVDGTFMSYMCMFYENKIINAIMSHFPHDYAVLMFDGFMVYGEGPSLESLSDFVKSEFQMDISFCIKPHDTSIQIPSDWKPNLPIEEEQVSDLTAVNQTLCVFPHWKYCNQELYVFDELTGIWTTSVAVHRDTLTKYAPAPYCCSVKHMNALLTLIISKCRDDNWFQDNQDSSLGKLLFKNGWYDNEFHPGFDHRIVFFARLEFDWSPPCYEFMEKVAQRVFYNPLNEADGEYLIQVLAHALMGNRKKHILFGLGDANGGKSQVTEIILNAIGAYGTVFNSASLCCNNNNADDGAKNRVWLLKRFYRILISNELNQSAVLNSTIIKSIASGGKDGLEGRTHNKEEQRFVPHFTSIVLANDMAKFSTYDSGIDSRVKVVSFDKVFVDNPTLPTQRKADNSLSADSKTPAFRKAMIDLFLDRYAKPFVEPESVSNYKKSWIAETPNIMDAFLLDYEITDLETDRIPSSEIQEWLKAGKYEISSVKLCRDLQKHLTSIGKEYVNKVCKYNGKNTQCILKLKKVEEEFNEL